MELKNNIIQTLEKEVQPALGCTEPVAVALAVAIAVTYLDGESIGKVNVQVSPNIFKNGLGVGIPNSSYIGLDIAAALGAIGGNPELGLKVLESINSIDEIRALQFIRDGKLSVQVKDTDSKILIIAYAESKNHYSKVTIKNRHDEVISVIKDGQVLLDKEELLQMHENNVDLINQSSIKDIINSIEQMSYEELSFLKEGVKMNLKIAEAGLTQKSGIGVGAGLKKNIEDGVLADGLISQAMILTAAASDARMSGVNLPVMSSNGSGNNGLTAILPIAAYAELNNITDEELVKALAISHIINCYVKKHIGRLSALCGCTIASATGATAALAWLFGCDQTGIEGAMNNMIADLSGAICDGAKVGCALKLSTAAYISVKYAMLAKNNCIVPHNNGIISTSIEKTIDNLGRLSKEGMQLTDSVILSIMKDMES